MFRLNDMNDRYIPVSYTHLDVYKRQGRKLQSTKIQLHRNITFLLYQCTYADMQFSNCQSVSVLCGKSNFNDSLIPLYACNFVPPSARLVCKVRCFRSLCVNKEKGEIIFTESFTGSDFPLLLINGLKRHYKKQLTVCSKL